LRRSPSKGKAAESLLVRAKRDAGSLTRIEVTGHAGFAAAGSDIVCAAVSALVMTAANGVARVCGALVRVSDDPSGAFVLDVPDGGGACAQSVLETTLAGLRAIARTYPDHIRVLVHNAARSPQRRSARRTGAARRSAKTARPRKGA